MSRPTQASLTAHSTSLICQDTDLRGPITVGPSVIIHPKATVLAVGGPIIIEEGCIIEELCVIVNRRKEAMTIGKHNHFMVGCRIESPSIGDYNTFQPRSTASSAVIISDHCVLSAGVTLWSFPTLLDSEIETLLPYTVVYGADSARKTWDGSGQQSEMNLRTKHAEYLREIMPKFNRLRTTS
ncbi:hypothetical protein L204_100361 [Cryptococcus depauperatus]